MNLAGIRRRGGVVAVGDDGTELRFTEVTLGDLAVFQDWLKQRQIKELERRQRELVTLGKELGCDPVKLMQEVLRPMTDDDLDAAMESFEGLSYLAYLSLKHDDKSIKHQDVMDALTPDDLRRATQYMLPRPEAAAKNQPATAATP